MGLAILDELIVLCRNPSNTPIALSDTCPHR
jgi:phenylpropionate dioxygenase-like ring-hydroxylating dioxygenase large terminal subunit